MLHLAPGAAWRVHSKGTRFKRLATYDVRRIVNQKRVEANLVLYQCAFWRIIIHTAMPKRPQGSPLHQGYTRECDLVLVKTASGTQDTPTRRGIR